MENSEAKSRISGENKTQSASSGRNTPAEQSSNEWSKKLASTKLSRRQALQVLAGAIGGTALGGLLPSCNYTAGPPNSNTAQATSNPIVIENQQAGSSDWQMKRKGYKVSKDIKGQIKGYASATSVNKGGQIDFHVTVNPAQKFTIDVYRMGWYNGQGGRLLQNIGPLDGITQPKPTPDPTTGLIDCNWPSSYTLTVPDTWTSGIYLAVLTNEKNFQNYIIFVVRDDASTAALLYQLSITSYQAYNHYPNDKTTGKSLYDTGSWGAPIKATGAQGAAKVSFNRPYSSGAGSGKFVNAFPTGDWDRHFVNWIEKSGYDVTYSTNLDTHQNGAALKNHRGFLSVGHDEYWSQQMYDAVESARDSGVHLAFFGSDTCYWQVRFEPDANNVPDRTMVCYKEARSDPVQDSTTTVEWRDPLLNRSEQGLVGVQYTAVVENYLNTPYVVKNSSNWVYNGTGFADGDEVAGLVGYEADRYFSEYTQPQGTDYTLLSQSPLVRNDSDIADYSNSSIYKAPSGAWVFAAGTNQWSWGLDMSGVVDSRIEQTTANILNTFTGAFAPPSG
jgi:N,N-dimethylformamidase beta subunit-like, C-terminal